MFHRIKTWFTSSSSQDSILHLDLARVLGSTLIASVIVSIFSILSALVTHTSNWERLVRDAVSVLIISLILWFFLRRGYTRFVSYGVIIGFGAFATFSAYTGVGVRGTSYGMFLLVVIVSALFINRRAAYITAIVGSLIGLGLFYAHREGLLVNADRPLSETASWLIQVAYFLVAAVILDVALRQIDRALAQAKLDLEERKHAEDALRTSEQKFRRFFRTSPAAMMIASDQGILDVNEAFLRLIGFTREEVLGRSTEQLNLWVNPGDYERINAELGTRPGSILRDFEFAFRHKSGEVRYVVVSTEVIDLEDKTQYIVSALDITERKLAQEKILDLNVTLEQRINERTAQLVASEERYRLITNISSDYVFSTALDAQGKTTHTWVAGAFESIMGCSFDEYLASGGWISFLHPDDLQQDAQDMAILHENQPVTTEVRIFTKTGEIRWVRVYAQPIWNSEENRLSGIYGAVQNITVRKQTEEALREAELRYRTLVERTSVVIYRDTPDNASTTLYISPQIEILLGYTPEEWVSGHLHWQDLVHPEDRAHAITQVETHPQNGGSFTGEYRMYSRDGRWVWVRDEAVVVTDTDGTPLFVQGVLIDITEQKKAETQAQEVTKGLRSVVEVADELILIPDLDTFYRRAVELAREKLGLERCSLFLFDEDLKYQLGTYGTNDQGLTTDERFLKLALKNEVAINLLIESERSMLIVEGRHVAWDDIEQSRIVGRGWIATTLIRSSTQPIGVFSNDAAITNSPVNEIQQEILLVYCSLLGNIIERKRAEEALKNNEKRFRALVEQLPAITYSDDIAQLGRTVYISPQIETVLGYSPKEWLDGELDFWLSHIHPDDQARALEDFESCFRDGLPIISEYRMFSKSGKIVWMQDRAVRLKDENGQPLMIQGVMTDITEQKHTEERARSVSQGLRAVLEVADELIMAPDLETIYRRAVELAREKLGIERCGLFFFDQNLISQIGTFGTDNYGNTTDERGIEREISSWTAEALLTKGERSWLISDSPLSYWDESAQQQVVGRGWIASTIIRSATQPIGVFYNDTAISHRPVNETQQEILAIYCSLLGNIIERKRFEHHLKEQTTHLATIYELSREIVSSLDLEQVYAVAHRAVRQLIPTDAFFIALVDEEHQEVQDVYLFDQEQRWPSRRTPLSTRGMTTHVIQTGESLYINDVADPTIQSFGTIHFGTGDRTRSVLVVPMKLSGKAIGVISSQHYQPNMYTIEHGQVLESLANQIAIAIDHGRLVQSLRLQAAALNAAANAIAITDLEGVIQWTNPAFTTLTGYSFKEVLGKTFHLLKSGLHDKEFYKILWNTILEGNIWQGEITNRRKDGSLYIEETVITPVRNEQGDIFRYIAIKQDITARKQGEETLRKSETKFRQLIASAPDAILGVNRQGEITLVNAQIESKFGYSADELMGQSVEILLPERFHAKHKTHRTHFIADPQGRSMGAGMELYGRHKSGSEFPVEISLSYSETETGLLLIAFVRDITDRKHSEAREQRRRLLLEKVIELGKTVTQETDLDTCLRQIHQSIQKGLEFDRVGLFLYEKQTQLIHGIYGTSRTGELESNSWYTQDATQSESWQNALRHTSGINYIENYSALHQPPPEDEMFGVKEHLSIAAWAGETPIALISVDNLITQRKITPEQMEGLRLFAGYAGLAIENARWNAQLGERVTERTAELQTANQELQAFTYTIAHDLRAPARAMIGFSGLLQENLTGKVELDPISQSYLARVQNGAKRMGQMIDELLDYTRLGRILIYKQPVDMNDLVNQVLAKRQEEILSKPIEIELAVLPACEGDIKLLEQVWDQLLTNALKYSQSRSLVKIDIGSGVKDEKIYYFIRDNGIGFDMQYLNKIFGVFHRLHIEDEYEGTGMGLAIVSRIVERHGGHIWAEAMPEKGATFFFTLE